MTTRRDLLVALGASALAAPLFSVAQQPGKVWRVGALQPGSRSPGGGVLLFRAFFEGLRDLGYVEGRNLVVHREFAGNDMQRLPELVAMLLKQNVDLIVTSGTNAVGVAKQATTTLPIVALSITDPVGSGFAASLARPGGNITGFTNLGEEIGIKRLEILCEIAPHVNRIARIHNPDNPVHARSRSSYEAIARKIGKEIVYVEVRAADQLDAAFDRITRARAGALTVGEDGVINSLRSRIAALALQHKLPTMFWSLGPAGDGLASYGLNFAAQGRQAATIAVKIFQGSKPADLPFQQPTEFDLTINLKTARALGITITQSVLIRATRVIE
jgi:putative ABC transport system substrate-binding protein